MRDIVMNMRVESLVLVVAGLLAFMFVGCSVDSEGYYSQFCRKDSDCKAGYACTDSGMCVPVDTLPVIDGDMDEDSEDSEGNQNSCIDNDKFKQNHSLSSAGLVSDGVYEFLTLCPGADDWYLFQNDGFSSDSSPELTVYTRAISPYALGLGINLRSGSKAVSASHDTDGISFVNLPVTDVSTYIQIVPEMFNARYEQLNHYHMAIMYSPIQDCGGDAVAKEDLPTDSTPLAEGLYKLASCPGDLQNTYKIVLPKRQNLFVAVLTDASGEGTRVELLDSDGVLLDSGSDQLNLFKYPGRDDSERTFYLRLSFPWVDGAKGNSHRGIGYIIDLNLTYEPPFECVDDELEPNQTEQQAISIDEFPAVLYNMALCPNADVDWFKVPIPHGGDVVFKLKSLHDTESIFTMEFYVDGALVSSAGPSTGTLELTYHVSDDLTFVEPVYEVMVKAENLDARGVRYELSMEYR